MITLPGKLLLKARAATLFLLESEHCVSTADTIAISRNACRHSSGRDV